MKIYLIILSLLFTLLFNNSVASNIQATATKQGHQQSNRLAFQQEKNAITSRHLSGSYGILAVILLFGLIVVYLWHKRSSLLSRSGGIHKKNNIVVNSVKVSNKTMLYIVSDGISEIWFTEHQQGITVLKADKSEQD